MNELRFEFGKNWSSFVDSALNEGRVAVAVASLRRLLSRSDLHAQSFLDSGCGLSALAVLTLGTRFTRLNGYGTR